MSELTWWKNKMGREPMLTPAEEIILGGMVREWLDHPDGPDKAPKAIQRRGKRAQDRMVVANLRLATDYVLKQCRHIISSGFSAEDLISEAVSGLTVAAQRFDPSKGYKFSTYAYWWIRQGVTRWTETKGKLIRTPADHAQRLRDARYARIKLSQELGRQPAVGEIAEEIGITVERLESLMITSYKPTSLDLIVCEDGTLLDTKFSTPNDDADDMDPERMELAWRRLYRLPVEQRILMAVLYGLCGLPQMTIEEIADCARLPVTEVRRVKMSALVTLRREEGKDRKYVQPSRAKPLPSLEHLRESLAPILPDRLLRPEDVSSHSAEAVIPGLAVSGDGGNLQSHDAGEAGFKGHLLPDVGADHFTDGMPQDIRREALNVPDVALQLEFCSQTDVSPEPRGLCHAA